MRSIMFRGFSIMLVLGMLLVSGCGSAAQPTPTATPTSTVTSAPTLTATATRRPSPTPQSPFYLEEFQGDMEGWTYMLATNEKDADEKVEVNPSQGGLWVKIDVRDTHLYLFNTEFEYDDVRMEFEAENLGRNNNNISMLCRYAPDLGWYVFLISNSGLVGIYRASIKKNMVDYEQLIEGGSEYINMGKGLNTYAVTCKGDELSLEINDHLWRTVKDDTYANGQIGLSIMSFNVLPVEVVIKWLDITKP
jgi:hypothetical protein